MGFAEVLKNDCAADWDAAVNHPFVDQLLDGSLSDDHLRGYLVQDYQFCDAFTALLGQAVASAPSLTSRLVFARVLGAFASDENTYFQDCFEELSVPETDREAPSLSPVTRGLRCPHAERDIHPLLPGCAGCAAGGGMAVWRLGKPGH